MPFIPLRRASSAGTQAIGNRNMARRTAEEKSEGFGEIIRTIIYALLIALVFRIFLFQPFSIPSSSMKSTLLIGDYLFVSKYAYGYSRHSIPFSPPLFEGRIWFTPPKRGDVIVFKNRNDENKDYIKRLIGLPGDKIRVKQGLLHIDGAAVAVQEVEPFVEPLELGGGGRHQACLRDDVIEGEKVCIKERALETLPNGVEHFILNANTNRGGADNTKVYEVPAGHYFFMGDNRDNSGDSRSYKVGMVPEEDLIGRAEIIFLSSDGSPFIPWKWRFSRFFDLIN